jgi:ATP synthase protein I
MPLDNKPVNEESNSSAPAKSNNFSSQFAMAMELPFVLVGAVLLGGVLGFFLDRWFHTRPYLMLVFGALGFFGGVRDIIRRTSGNRS